MASWIEQHLDLLKWSAKQEGKWKRPRKNKKLRWVNSEYIQECEDLTEAFDEIGWEFEFDGEDIVGIDFCREKLGDENDIFNSIVCMSKKVLT